MRTRTKEVLLECFGPIAVLLITAAFLVHAVGCKKRAPRTHGRVQAVHVYHMADGSRAYQSTDGTWYWYIVNSPTQMIGSGQIGTWTHQYFSPVGYPGIKIVAEDEEELSALEASTQVSSLPGQPELDEVN